MNRDELTKIEQSFGKAVQAGYNWILPKCPLCGEEWTFRFVDSPDVWNCPACGKVGSWQSLTDIMAEPEPMRPTRYPDKPAMPEGLIALEEWKPIEAGERIPTGFGQLDRYLEGFDEGGLTILTGKRGEGKSTLASQMAINAIQNAVPVFFYSGELNVRLFRHWIYAQAAGERWVFSYEDKFGATRYKVDDYAEVEIGKWLNRRLVLYDNTVVKASERNSILERMKIAHEFSGSKLYFVDNLMTARYNIDHEKDYYRAQSNFVGMLSDFAKQHKVHVVLVAHPNKGDSQDANERVSGSGDITNRADNVLWMKKAGKDEQQREGCDAFIQITKNREHGVMGRINCNFLQASKRFVPTQGECIEKYGWEK